MNKKRIGLVGIVAVICLFIVIVGTIGSKEKKAVVWDADGNEIAVLTYADEDIQYACEETYQSFIDVVVCEAVDIIMEQENIKQSEAKELLVQEQMQFYTTFQKQALDAIVTAYEANKNIKKEEFAAVLGGIHGEIYACYSVSVKEHENMVLYATYPASAIKPLSVYSQMIEDGSICWSDKVEDAPYISQKADGSEVEIPANTKDCTYEEQFIETAVKKSLNTIPIRLLKEYGVQKSCEFLSENFGISFERELRALKNNGEDEILANIALGYLTAGITPKELFSYYQVFANGGTYQQAYTIQSIKCGESIYYQHKDECNQVFSEETAYIMNRLLKQVVTEDGTGADAQIEGIDLCGKTGTSSSYKDNWFVGLTPNYIGAVWYGLEYAQMGRNANESVIVCRDMMSQMEDVYGISFEKPKQIIEKEYCKKTGLLAGESCEQTSIGYYKQGELPEICICN